jgi:peptidoglycan/xylan/chitin deacetylase (PgdA/CDA1 family)
MIDPVSRYLHRQAGIHGPVMLMYHSITPDKGTPDWPWSVSLQRFRDLLNFLADEGYVTPTMSELILAPKRWMGRTAVITFDDGYVDNLAACEELTKMNMRASWFIVTGSIGQEPTWSADGRPNGRLLNADELRDMQAGGMEIGSHTISHANLAKTDDACLQMELVESKTALSDILGSTVTGFANPYGVWDSRCANAVQQAGYAAACTTSTGWAMRDGDPYRLRRLSIYNTDTISSFGRKLAYAANDVSWMDILYLHALSAIRRLNVGS